MNNAWFVFILSTEVLHKEVYPNITIQGSIWGDISISPPSGAQVLDPFFMKKYEVLRCVPLIWYMCVNLLKVKYSYDQKKKPFNLILYLILLEISTFLSFRIVSNSPSLSLFIKILRIKMLKINDPFLRKRNLLCDCIDLI